MRHGLTAAASRVFMSVLLPAFCSAACLATPSWSAHAEAAADLVGTSLTVHVSGGWLTAEWIVRNQGTTAAAGPWSDALYLSPAAGCCRDASPMGSVDSPPASPVDAGTTYTQRASVKVETLPLGEYYLIVKVNALGGLAESNVANNEFSSPFRVAPQVDLRPYSMSVPATASTQQSIAVSWTVANEVSGPFPEPATAELWQDNLYISPTATCCAGATFLGSSPHTGGLPVNQRYSHSQQFTIPDLPAGDYYLVLNVDATDAQPEADEANTYALPIRITAPDLVISQLKAPLIASAQQSISVSWNVANHGDGATITPWEDALYLSADRTCCAGASRLGSWPRTTPLGIAAGYTLGKTVTVPALSAGTYYLVARTNDTGSLHEQAEANNQVAAAITVTTPDLTPTALTAAASVAAGQLLAVSWTVRNQGTGPATGAWTDQVYLSSTGACCDGATLLGQAARASLSSGVSYTQSKSFTVPELAAGAYYLVVRTDGDDVLQEASESNNTRVVPITITNADLSPTALIAPAVVSAQQPITVSWTVKNQGSGPAAASWTDEIYLSPIAACCADAISLGRWTWTTAVAAGAAYKQTKTITVPAVAAGAYHLIARTDASEARYETNESNNQRTLPITVTTPDLVPTALTAPTAAESAHAISISWTVRNQGTGPTIGSWTDRVYISAGSTCCAGTTSLGSFSRTAALSIGASYTQTRTVTLPPLAAGTYVLTVWTDSSGQLHEASKANNLRQVSLTVSSTSVPPPAVLAITSVNGGKDPTAGTKFSVVVESRDLGGIRRDVTLATSLRIKLKTGTGALAGTLTGTVPAGGSQATISGVIYKKAEDGVALTATRTAGDQLTAGDSSPFGVDPGAIAAYAVALSSPVQSGAGFSITVTARDQYANAVSTDNGTLVTLRSSSGHVLFDANGDGDFGDPTKALTAGVATAVAKGTIAESTTITATDSSGKTGSGSLTVTAGTASSLAFTRQPGAALAGAAIPGPPTVAVKDAFGNTITSSTVPITIAIAENPGGGALGGAMDKAAVAGVASFSNLTISEPGNGYTLRASSPGLAAATSSPFAIAPTKGTIAGRITRSPTGTGVQAATVQALQSGLVKASTVSDADGVFAMAGLAPGAYDVRVSAAGYHPQSRTGVGVTSGNTSTVNVALVALAGPTIRITSPAEGSIITRPVVLVRGEIGSLAAADAGVSVNGVPALVGGNQFAAFVPVEPGWDTVTAILASPTVAMAEDSVSVQVTPQPGAAAVYITASPRVGSSPLRTTLRATVSVPVAEYQWDVQSDGIIDRAGPAVDEVSVQYQTPGLYFAELTATDAQGRQLTEVAPVLALEAQALTTLLETKWRDLKDRLRVGNVTGALDLVAQHRRDQYRDVFQHLTIPLAQIDQVLTDIRFVQWREATVEYEMLRSDERGRLSYLIRFVLDADGIWRIADM